MYEERYWAAQKALDEILGPNEEDGAGEGLVAEIWLVAEQRDEARSEVDRLRTQLAEAQRVAATCTCQAWPPEGPAPDCPVHGAIRALNEAQAALAEAQRERDAARTALAASTGSEKRLVKEREEARMYQQMAEDRAALADAAVGEYERVLADRDLMKPVVEALRALIELKDGPRDEAYERAKPSAWAAARICLRLADRHLAAIDSTTPKEATDIAPAPDQTGVQLEGRDPPR